MQKTIKIYETKWGRKPFEKWFASLTDSATRNKIKSRLNRLAFNDYGIYKFLGGNIFELKINYGPGYRIYFTEKEEIIVLIAGTKKTQEKDIKKAKKYMLNIRKSSLEKK